MKMYIPEIGTELLTTAPWEFELTKEYRQKLWDQIVPSDFGAGCTKCENYRKCEEHSSAMITLPADSRLVVDRIYIRKGIKQFSSITLRLTECSDAEAFVTGKVPFTKAGSKSTRFWVSLADFNNLEADILVDTVIQKGAKPTRGEAVTLYEWAERCKKVRDPRWWVSGTINNQPVEMVTSVYYGRATAPGYWNKVSIPSYLVIMGNKEVNPFILLETTSLMSPDKTIGVGPARISGVSSDPDTARSLHVQHYIRSGLSVQFDLTFYKVIEV